MNKENEGHTYFGCDKISDIAVALGFQTPSQELLRHISDFLEQAASYYSGMSERKRNSPTPAPSVRLRKFDGLQQRSHQLYLDLLGLDRSVSAELFDAASDLSAKKKNPNGRAELQAAIEGLLAIERALMAAKRHAKETADLKQIEALVHKKKATGKSQDEARMFYFRQLSELIKQLQADVPRATYSNATGKANGPLADYLLLAFEPFPTPADFSALVRAYDEFLKQERQRPGR